MARSDDVANGESVQILKNGPGCRPYIVYPFTEDTGWTFNTAFRARDNIAKLYLTPSEEDRGISAKSRYGSYVLIEPHTKHSNLRWPIEKWATLVRSRSDLTFVQHIHAHSPLVPGAIYEPATFREACGLVKQSSVYIRSESGMLHAAAALGSPTIAIWGGCMDWDVLGNYPGEHGIVDLGPHSPCGRWHPCDHCRSVMTSIPVHLVSTAIDSVLARAA